VTPATLTFPSQQPGVTSAPEAVTVTNIGGAMLTGLNAQILGTPTAVFSISGTSCGATLAAGASCVMQVVFNPATTGGSAGTLNISSSSPGVAAVDVGLSGTGQTASGLNISPATLSFGAVAQGGTSAAQTVTISNTSAYAASVLSVGVSQGFSWTQYTGIVLTHSHGHGHGHIDGKFGLDCDGGNSDVRWDRSGGSEPSGVTGFDQFFGHWGGAEQFCNDGYGDESGNRRERDGAGAHCVCGLHAGE
jgi:hypothetical protein